jgi:hypothetical protein
LRYLLAFLLVLATPALAHKHGRPDLNAWFQQLHNANGTNCCDATEAMSIEDPDWEFTPDAEQVCTPSTLFSQGQACFETHYRVRLEGKWIAVPDSRVVLDPNKFGQALVWPVYISGHPTEVRCFMPGSGV